MILKTTFTKSVLFIIFDFIIFLIFTFILGIAYILVGIYKTSIIFIAKQILNRNLIPFDGLKVFNYIFLKADVHKFVRKNTSLKEDVEKHTQDDVKNRFYTNVGFVLTYKGNQYDLKSIQNLFFEKFFNESNLEYSTKYLNLQVKVVKFGCYLFKEKVKDGIDLNTQIYSVNIPNPMTLEEFLADWYVQPFRSCLLWEVVLINANNNNNNEEMRSNYLALKIHHCLADGYTLTHLLDRLCGKKTKYIVQDFKSTNWENIMNSIRTPRTLFNLLREMYSLGKQKPVKNEHKDYETWISYGTLELKKINFIKRRMNVEFQCILHSLLAGALRELYSAKKLEIPQSAILTGTLPWPKHPFNETMTNWMSIALLEVPINETSTRNRLLDINKNFKQYHSKGLNKMFVQGLGPLLELCPCFLYNWLYDLRISASWSALLFGDNYELFGEKISNIHVMGGTQMEETAIQGFSVSHSNQLDYTIIANKQLISQEDINRITREFIPKELDQLYANEVFGGEISAA